jgi:hydrogenase/urease accessory protein HupE
MPKEGWSIRLWHFLRTAIIVELGIAAFVAAVGLLLGWRSPREFGEGLIYAGIGACLLGAASVLRSLGMSRGAEYQYGQSVGFRSIDENVREAMKESKESYSFLLLMAIVGVVAFLAGGIITELG